MDREEAIKALQYERKTALHENKGAFDMAIEALSTSEIPNKCEDAISRADAISLFKDDVAAVNELMQLESVHPKVCECEDAISRQAVIDILRYECSDKVERYLRDKVNALPSDTQKQKMWRWIPVSERLPEDRDWNLAVFREKDTGYQCIPRVASYVGHDMWIVIDADSVDRGWFSDLECIAWMPLPEPYEP